MHQHSILLAQGTTSTTVAASAKSSGSYLPLLVIIAIFAVVYFLFIRPRQQRLRQQQAESRQVGLGDEVMTAGGILGRVVAVDGDEIGVEVAPGVVMTFLRRAVSRRPGQPAPPPPVQTTDDPWSTPPAGEPNTGEEPPSEPGDRLD